ncbi:MAG: tetratricopeptide repeat protein [Alphaproteobacteria bacterium]|nr:tetratricopeptide repeat protein [Alphaproteobacteria bacterium]
MPSLPQLDTLHEALVAASRRGGREDEDAERAAAYAEALLLPLFTEPVDLVAAQAFWQARLPGVPLNELLTQIRGVLPATPANAALYRAIAMTFPERPKLVPLYNLAWTLSHGCEDWEAALPLLERCHKMASKDEDVLLVLGLARARLGDIDGAVEAYDALTRVSPDALGPWLNAGQTLKEAGRFAEARPYMARAVELDPDPVHLHVYGHVLQGAGEPELAERVLREAIEGYSKRIRSDKSDADSRFWRAAALARLGDAERALDELAATLRMQPSLRADARDEEDFLPLHTHPRWAEIVS